MSKPQLNKPDVETTTTKPIIETQCTSCSKYPLKNYKINFKEQEVLKEFEGLGYKVKVNEDKILILENLIENITFQINKLTKRYYVVETKTRNAVLISFVEHQLLHRLFEIWGWI